MFSLFAKQSLEIYSKPLLVFKCFRNNVSKCRISSLNLAEQEYDEPFREPTPYQLNVLKRKFKINYFKPEQWQIISSVLEEKQDQYIVLPSGYGKSLCYQYPPVYSNGLSIVISPLISLMEDQVLSLEKNKIPACYLGHTQENRIDIVDKLLRGHYRILYITPESLLSAKGLELLKNIRKTNNINLIAVDEAHCIIQWGKNFRPAYGTISKIRELFPDIPFLSLTATASFQEHEMIINNLKLRNPHITYVPFACDNLYMITKKMGIEPYGDIAEVLLDDTKKYNIDGGSVIIYCLTKKQVIKITSILKKLGIQCEAYHSGVDKNERELILKNFMSNKIRIIVATTAFGMGINKPDIRVIIHYGTPLSMEGYSQEIGRAGRDGKPSLCVLIHSSSDFTIHRYLSNFHSFSNQTRIENENKSTVMKKYLATTICRKHFISSHFDGSKIISSPRLSSFCCDNCANRYTVHSQPMDLTRDSELIFNTIKNLQPISLGAKSIVSVIKGENKKYTSNEFYGCGSYKSEDWWNNLIFRLEMEHFLKIKASLVGTKLYSKLILDHKGTKWLNDRDYGNSRLIILQSTYNLNA